MLNHIVLMGRLTRDPELRHTVNGNAVASFAIACERDFASNGGEKDVDFIDVVAWRSTADFVTKYFSKGRMAVISGRLQMRNWQDRNGNKRVSAEIVAGNVYFGDSKRDSDNNNGSSYAPRSYDGGCNSDPAPASRPQMADDFAPLEGDDSDLPF